MEEVKMKKDLSHIIRRGIKLCEHAKLLPEEKHIQVNLDSLTIKLTTCNICRKIAEEDEERQIQLSQRRSELARLY
jgi:hypothetical protein